MEVAAKFGPTFAAQAGKVLRGGRDARPADGRDQAVKEPYGPLLRVLSCAFGGAFCPSHLYKGTDVRTNPVTQKPVGTGAVQVRRNGCAATASVWSATTSIGISRSPISTASSSKIMPNAGSRTQALLAGEVDYIQFVYFPPSDGKTGRGQPQHQARARPAIRRTCCYALLQPEEEAVRRRAGAATRCWWRPIGSTSSTTPSSARQGRERRPGRSRSHGRPIRRSTTTRAIPSIRRRPARCSRRPATRPTPTASASSWHHL